MKNASRTQSRNIDKLFDLAIAAGDRNKFIIERTSVSGDCISAVFRFKSGRCQVYCAERDTVIYVNRLEQFMDNEQHEWVNIELENITTVPATFEVVDLNDPKQMAYHFPSIAKASTSHYASTN